MKMTEAMGLARGPFGPHGHGRGGRSSVVRVVSWRVFSSLVLVLIWCVIGLDLLALVRVQSFEITDGESSYVVQIHSSRDGFVPPADDSLRPSLMTVRSGKRFECFLPKQAQPESRWEDDAELDQSAKDERALLEFGRVAAKKIRPKCIQFTHSKGQWIYEVCPGILVRKINLAVPSPPASANAGGSSSPSASSDQMHRLQDPAVPQQPNAAALAAARRGGGTSNDPMAKARGLEASANAEIVDIGTYASDGVDSLVDFNEFAIADILPKLAQSHGKRVYTQVFRVKSKAPSTAAQQQDPIAAHDANEATEPAQEGTIKLQFMCRGNLGGKTAAQDDAVAAIVRAPSQPDATGFLVVSRLFCHSRFTDSSSEEFSVSSLLAPLVSMNTCVKRNEGWWTYEFCFGQHIRQYHREPDGQITVEYLLGQYDRDQNKDLEATNGALVSEHIDGTHDMPRPAFLEIYSDGTACHEFEKPRPRTARVYYYCGTGSGLASHYILSIKETQTCAYTIKVSTPALCDHPHFINEEQTSEDNAEIVHCLPVEEDLANSARSDEL